MPGNLPTRNGVRNRSSSPAAPQDHLARHARPGGIFHCLRLLTLLSAVPRYGRSQECRWRSAITTLKTFRASPRATRTPVAPTTLRTLPPIGHHLHETLRSRQGPVSSDVRRWLAASGTTDAPRHLRTSCRLPLLSQPPVGASLHSGQKRVTLAKVIV